MSNVTGIVYKELQKTEETEVKADLVHQHGQMFTETD